VEEKNINGKMKNIMLIYNLTSVLLEIINQNSDYFDKLLIIDENKFIANNKIKLAIILKTLTDILIQITTIAAQVKLHFIAINSCYIKIVFII